MPLSLRGASIVNDGYVNIEDIGSTADGDSLLCQTDAPGCRGHNGQQSPGDWFLPNGALLDPTEPKGGYRISRSTCVVRLYRDLDSADSAQRGRFRCVIPENNRVDQTHYVNICKCISCVNV